MPIVIEPEEHDCLKCTASGNCPMESIMRDSIAFEQEAIDALKSHSGLEGYLDAAEMLDYTQLITLMVMRDSKAVKRLLSTIRIGGLVRGYALRRNKELELLLESKE